MINLLPYEYKDEIRAARTNVILVRYIAILLLAAGVLGALVVGSYITLNGTKANAEEKEAQNTARLAQYQDIRNRSDAFRTDLATAKSILDSSISYSKLIYGIANAIPRGVVLDDLDLDPSTLGTSMTLNASAKTVADATKLRDALAANSQVFTGVQLQSLRSSGSSTGDAYPVKVTMSVVINKGIAQ